MRTPEPKYLVVRIDDDAKGVTVGRIRYVYGWIESSHGTADHAIDARIQRERKEPGVTFVTVLPERRNLGRMVLVPVETSLTFPEGAL